MAFHSLADGFTVLGMPGIHLSCCARDPSILDLGGRITLECHSKDEGFEAAWSYRDVGQIQTRLHTLLLTDLAAISVDTACSCRQGKHAATP